MSNLLVKEAPIAHTSFADTYLHIRKATEALCSTLGDEAYTVQPAEFVSPPKWHLGHTTWFFETFALKPHLEGYQEFNQDFNYLFNSYYETVGERVQRNHRGMLFRPYVADIYAYRSHVDEAMQQLIPQADDELKAVIMLGLQHEQQHQELLTTDLKYTFAQNPLFPVWDSRRTLAQYRQPQAYDWMEVEEGVYEIGFDGEGFCYDNELGRHKQYIQHCALMSRPVTNGEYLEFIEAGGYEDFRYWLSEGWDWVKTNNIKNPMHWHKRDGEWHFFHIDGMQALDKDVPAMHLSYFEADAYARWKGLRLPTEFEWETAARMYPTAFENSAVWEWTQSAYLPYPNFKIAEGAIGEYNGKFMVNQMVLRGSSLATPKGHSRVSYRNFFHAHLQWQFSGIRLAKDL